MKPSANNLVNESCRCQTVLWFTTLFLSLWLSSRAFALDPARSLYQYNCRTWTRQSGLPANSISSLQQDNDGYLWFGTIAGPVRFDGINFDLIDLGKLPEFRATETTSL